MLLSNAAIKNRTTVGVLVVLIVFAGTVSYVTLPREAAPDVPIPLIMVSTVYEGVSPEDMESSVTMKIEEELTGLKGVKEIRSTSREGTSLIVIEFHPDVVVEDALQYVRDKVDQAKRELPTEAEDPSLSEVNIAEFPVIMVNVSGPISPVRLKAIAERLEDEFEQITGVLGSEVLGALEREIRLEFDPKRLAIYKIAIGELTGLIPGEHVNVSAGGLETPRVKFNVRVPAEFDEPVDMGSLILTMRDGKPIYLKDVATVRDTYKDRDTYSRLDGKDSITVTVKKRIGANILEVSEKVKAILAEARKHVPKGVTLDVTMDQSTDVKRMVVDLENNILSGLVLVVAVLMLALGFRTSLIVALAIPMSMLISFAILQAMGVTLNMMVLFSLILSLGMLVDNAIVIVENIFRYMEMGCGRIEAAKRGTAEVAWPVITSTGTTVAAFAPMLLWQGMVGEFMKFLPMTVIIVLSSSLFVALVISPVATTVLASARGRKKSNSQVNGLQRAYRRLLGKALGTESSRLATLLLSVLALAAVGVVYVKYQHGTQFLPDFDPKRAIVNIRSPQGTGVRYSDFLSAMVEQRIESQREALEHVNSNVGSVGGVRGFGQGAGGPNIANITVTFRDYEDRPRPSTDVVDDIRESLSDLPGAEVSVSEEEMGPPTGAAVTVRIAGEEFDELARISEQAKALIAPIPGVVNLRSDYEAARPEMALLPDRSRATLLKVNASLIGQFLKACVFGREVSKYRQFNDEYDITLRLSESDRANVDNLYSLRVPNAEGDAIPLGSLGTFQYRGGYGDINRVDQKRVITLTADVKGRLAPDVLEDVQAELAALAPEMKDGYTISYAGEKEEQDKAAAFLKKAYVIAILAILMILVTQFNTLGVPLIVLLTVVLSLVGVGVGMLITASPFIIIMTGIGVVSLAGVVVNNAIVLLAYTRQLERQGKSLVEAAIEAGMTRLRPVLLTAITTILGLIPMATGKAFDFHNFQFITKSESSQWWAPMANTVIFGLGFATILTLVVVPTMYVFIYAGLERLGLGGLKRAGNGIEPAGETTKADAS